MATMAQRPTHHESDLLSSLLRSVRLEKTQSHSAPKVNPANYQTAQMVATAVKVAKDLAVDVSKVTPAISSANRFRLEDKIVGEGFSSKVRLARDLHTNMMVVCKVIDKRRLSKLSDKEAKPILREKDMLSTIEHDNVVKLLHSHEDDRFIYLFMDHYEGGDLKQLILKRGPLPERQARKVFRQVLNGVSFIHSQGIAHRDLKMDNILIDKTYTKLVICDFGLSDVVANEPFTQYCGSLPYAAPEIVQGTPYRGKPVDIWSLGVMLYAMLTGHYPFSGDTAADMSECISTCSVEFPRHLGSEVRDLVKKLLTKKPSKRPTVDEIKNHAWLKLTT